jgi:hypothetical protein
VTAQLALVYSVMTEKELDKQIRQLCDDLALLRYHTNDATRSPRGFPDLVIAGPGGIIYAN